MNFDLQRFDTESGPKWIRDGVSHFWANETYANAWCVPLVAGQSSGRLAFYHGGTRYIAASPIAGQNWYPSSGSVWGWLASDSTADDAGYLDAGDTDVTIWVSGVSSVTGDTDTAVLTLASGAAVSDVTVTGDTSAFFVVDGLDYSVVSGRLVRATPASAAVVNKMLRSNGKLFAQTINYVNPNADDSAIAEAVNALNALSANTGKGIFRLNRQRR